MRKELIDNLIKLKEIDTLKNRIMEIKGDPFTWEDFTEAQKQEIAQMAAALIPTPEDGKDYVLTEQDKNDIVEMVAQMVEDGVEGLDGEDGYTPVKGKDYFTDEEVEDLIIDVALSVESQLFPKVKNLQDTIDKIEGKSILDIVDGIEALEGEDRLDYQSLKNRPDIEKLIRDIATTYVGNGSGNGSGGASTFLQLTDTPSSYIANKWLQVNAGGTGLVFTDAPSVGSVAWGNITGTQSDVNVSGFNNDAGYTDYSPSGLTDNRMLKSDGNDDVQSTGFTVDDNDVFDTGSGQIHSTEGTLTDGASIAWNLTGKQVATVTLGGNRTLSNPTNMKSGGTYILTVKQDATGSRTLSYDTAYKWSGGTAPTLTTTANAVDIITFISDGTNMYGTIITDFQ